MNQFVSGAILMACWVVGLFFYRFWRSTRDRFFAMFAVAFWLLGLERVILAWFNLQDETNSFVYLIRSLAFLVIVVAIADKNRAGTGQPPGRGASRPLQRQPARGAR